MRAKKILILFFLMIFNQCGAAQNEIISNIGSRYVAFSALGNFTFELPETIRTAKIESEYARLFNIFLTKSKLSKQTTEDLQYIFRATELVIFYSNDRKYIPILENIFQILKDRGTAGANEKSGIFQAYVNVRLFEKAVELNKDDLSGKAEKLPQILREQEEMHQFCASSYKFPFPQSPF